MAESTRSEDEARGLDVARRFKEEQARRAAERLAAKQEADRKREAEERERQEKERAEEEVRQNRLREEEERRRIEREEDEQRQKEEEARVREREELARAEAEAAVARARAIAAAQMRKEVPVGRLAVEPARRASPAAPRNRGLRIAVVLLVLLAGGLVTVAFRPLDVSSFEKAATAHFGTPVKIGSAQLSLAPLPTLRFEHVAIGPAGEVKIAAVKTNGGLRMLFDARTNVKSLELEDATVPLSFLGAALWGKTQGDTLRVERVIARGLKLQAEGLELPAMDVDARLDAGGGLQSLSAATRDGTQTFSIAMTDGKAAVDLSATPFSLPFAPLVRFDYFTGKGTLAPSELNLSEFKAGALGGSFDGNARLRWGANWSLEGEFAARSVDPARLAPTLATTGRLEGRATFSMRAATPKRLHDTTRLDGTFTLQRGTLEFVDLARFLQGSGARGGTTSFSTMAGKASVRGGSVTLRQVRLGAGLLNATGEATVDPQNNLNGRFQVEISSQTRGAVSLGGTVSAPEVKR